MGGLVDGWMSGWDLVSNLALQSISSLAFLRFSYLNCEMKRLDKLTFKIFPEFKTLNS